MSFQANVSILFHSSYLQSLKTEAAPFSESVELALEKLLQALEKLSLLHLLTIVTLCYTATVLAHLKVPPRIF